MRLSPPTPIRGRGPTRLLAPWSRSAYTHVSNLRSKLGEGFEKPFIVAVHKVGYKFVEP